MKKANSISLLIIGMVLLVIGINSDNIYLRYSLLFTSIIINIIAVARSFREKQK